MVSNRSNVTTDLDGEHVEGDLDGEKRSLVLTSHMDCRPPFLKARNRTQSLNHLIDPVVSMGILSHCYRCS
jgi:hypothetical protein